MCYANRVKRYINPTLHVVRKRTTALAVQLTGADSLVHLSNLYVQVVEPEFEFEEDSVRVMTFDVQMGVLTFEPVEKPLELVLGDWLVYDGHDLSVVSNSVFTSMYVVPRLKNRKVRYGREEDREQKLRRVRDSETEYKLWEL